MGSSAGRLHFCNSSSSAPGSHKSLQITSFRKSSLALNSRAWRSLAILIVLSIGAYVGPAFAFEPNLVLNSDLSEGVGQNPEHWTVTSGAPAGSFKWVHDPGEPAALEIKNDPKSAARNSYWNQTVSLSQPGWYLLYAEVIAEEPGANAAILVEANDSRAFAVRSFSHWAPMTLYLKIEQPNQTVQIKCGVLANSAAGAMFRNLRLTRLGPPSERPPRLTLSQKAAFVDVQLAKPLPDETLWGDLLRPGTILATLFLFASLAYLDSRFDGATPSPDTAATSNISTRSELRKSLTVAGFLCFTLLVTWMVTRIVFVPGMRFAFVEPYAAGGDEPHYLIMIHSLLFNHSLELQRDYEDVEHGGSEAGAIFRGMQLDRHTIVVNRRTGHRAEGVWRSGRWYRTGGSEFDPSPDVYEIPAHPVGFPFLMALLIAPLRPLPSQVECYVGLVLMLISWLGMVATYFVARAFGMGRKWAMLAVVILLASPWLAYSRAYFAENFIGLALALSLLMLVLKLPVLAAMWSALAAFLKPPFALSIVGYFVEQLRVRAWKNIITVAMIFGLPIFGLLVFNYVVNGSALVHHIAWSFSFRNVYVALLSPTSGLLMYTPWAIFGLIGCARSFSSSSPRLALSRYIAPAVFLYIVLLSLTEFGPGYSYGPRYWVPFLPWLALATVQAMRRASKGQRAACAVMVAFALAIAVPGALRYGQLFGRLAVAAWRPK